MASNIKKVPAYETSSYQGTGAPGSADALVTNVTKYKIGTQYTATDTGILYVRTAVLGVIADFAPFLSTVAAQPSNLHGLNAPGNADANVTNVAANPIGSIYVATSTSKVYVRTAVAGVAADYTILN
jgi:hypothetical protein